MKLRILGSGGFQTIPRPCCPCKVCDEAREKGVPYSRNGPSIYIEDINAIIDTPKDIINSINRENIKTVESVFFTHWHPDHTEGFRLAEEITVDWTKNKPYELRNVKTPIKYIAPKEVMEQIKSIKSPFGSYTEFHQLMNFTELKEIEFEKEILMDNLSIKAINLNTPTNGEVCGYLIQEGEKRIIYSPCHTKALEADSIFENISLLIMNCPWFSPLSKGQEVTEDHPLRKQLFSMNELVKLIKKNNIKKTVITHIEEMWGKSFEDYKKLEEEYKEYNILFAYDGMKIEV